MTFADCQDLDINTVSQQAMLSVFARLTNAIDPDLLANVTMVIAGGKAVTLPFVQEAAARVLQKEIRVNEHMTESCFGSCAYAIVNAVES